MGCTHDLRVSYNSLQLTAWALSDFAMPIQKCTGAYTMVEMQVYKYPLHTSLTECFLLNNCSRVASRVTSRVTKTTKSYNSQGNKSQTNKANSSPQRCLISRLWKLIWHEFVRILTFKYTIEIHLFYINSISKSSSYTLKLLHLHLMRNTMRKHDYSNMLKIASHQNYQRTSLTFIENMYPIIYGVLHTSSHVIGWFTLYMWKSWIAISAWYDYKPRVSNNVLSSSDAQRFSVFRHLQESVHSITHWYGYNYQTSHLVDSPILTGAGKCTITLATLRPYLLSNISNPSPSIDEIQYSFFSHVPYQDAIDIVNRKKDLIACRMPLCSFASYLNLRQAKAVAKMHGVFVAWKAPLGTILLALTEHQCSNHCYDNVSVFNVYALMAKADQNQRKKLNASLNRSKHLETRRKKYQQQKIMPSFKNKKTEYNRKTFNKQKQAFPPSPPSDKLLQKIITGFCKDTHPSCFEESGCAVCGRLTTKKQLIALKDVQCSLEPLVRSGVTSIERTCETQKHKEVTGPILDADCSSMCTSCHTLLKKGNCPEMALANGIWLGKVPAELTRLTFVEKILISRVRHNRCVVRIASGRYKMRANAISFQNPIPKLYDVLPPPLEELDQVLACIFTGPCQPTEKDIERTPLLVRRKQVGKALQWLKLNHTDYHDIEISDNNLEKYPQNGTPVVIDYRMSVLNRDKEAMSVYDNEEEEGVETGDCSFVVHGLTGEEFSEMTLETIKARALEHLMKDGKIAFVGHAAQPESIYKNPQLFPSMMPWLFPYGLGGIGNGLHQGHISGLAHKRHLLMYHDKRFQMDPSFALIALNHEQIQESTTGGYLTAEKAYFPTVTERLHNIDLNVLTNISTRLSQNVRVKPETDAEKLCYKLMSDLEVISGRVQGSPASKKYMRNEIWSLISHIGAPSWFITVSPADNKHPICLYFADTNEEFKPDIRLPDETFRLVANNPAAAARFFHFMCQNFIKHVLGAGQKHPGIFGNTSAYYGTVEQQGRLTLHLHMLIWIKNALSPQEVRDRIMDQSSDFQQRMVQYIESICKGEFMNTCMSDISKQIKEAQKNDLEYLDPTKTMPEPPSPKCQESACTSCENCKQLDSWKVRFRRTVDDLLFRSNVHSCRMSTKDKHGNDVKKGCLNKQGKCRARFPREVVEQTLVDPLTGALIIKKGEAWLNTFTPLITYLFRCNSDTTSLLSGTAIKAIVAYVSDYVTKPGLKTYSIFDTIRRVFDRNSELISGSTDRKSTARSLMIKIVNALTAKMEIGSPMACLYLYGNPDHYTDHAFVNCYWRNYVQEVQSIWGSDQGDKPAKVVLNKNQGEYVGLSSVQDYMHRPFIYSDFNLYDWIRRSKKNRRSKAQESKCDDILEEDKEYDKEIVDDDVDELDVIENQSSQLGGGTNDACESTDYDSTDYDLSEEPINADEDDDTSDELNIGDNNAQHLYEDANKEYQFLKSHPQFQTHRVHCIDESDTIVPNFLGGSLPRCDQGDREFYCLTMLTLFKPWRTGKDLKSTDRTWDETFNEHKFTARQEQLMKNFNLRYECIDARDDYSAKLKDKETVSGIFPSWASSEVLKDLDHNIFLEYDDDNPIEDFTEESAYLEPTAKHLRKLEEMNHIENVVQNAGWLDKCPQEIDKIDAGIELKVNIPGTKWASIVKSARDAILMERGKHLPVNEEGVPPTSNNYNDIVIDNISYLRKNFKAEESEKQKIVDDTVKNFNLNTEQERAFRIVANHATMSQPGQLKMYLGGMGGTGKSQVIKALISFFEKRNESHRIMIVAPTGSAAALLNGSTYHSVLGINSTKDSETERNEHTLVALVKSRLDGVDYIFLDEVSMVACHEFYKISAQISKARNVADIPFGGINMIFAGDFAQLPPVGGQSLYKETVGTSVDASQSLHGQQSAIGKALWHQVTTVVILRQNMRQKTQSVEDAKLRRALENMRYAACTAEDIQFLRSRIAGKRKDQPHLADKDVRNVSIITAFNAPKDRINQLGSERFANETGQKLTHFYSVDRFGEEENPATEKKRMRKKRTLNNGDINPILQDVLWNLRHSASDHVPGKLSLCIGLPIIIRNNEATELCITKGQEGHVVGWQSAIGPKGQIVLDTLFIKLDCPAKIIKLEGLPENVVPLTRLPKSVLCVTPSEMALKINRSQVPILPNFAMTDYASQGKTRSMNVVDLTSCRDHLSYYTALSRGSTASGTIIVQGFNPYKIMHGTSGYLRQEFRELEILDEITKLSYEGNLPDSVNGKLRNARIRQFQLCKGIEYVPPNVPTQLKWTSSDPMNILTAITDSPWQIIKAKNKDALHHSTENIKKNNFSTHTFVAAKGTIPVVNMGQTIGIKRKANDSELLAKHSTKKKAKLSFTPSQESPVGIAWDEKNYSCAYDAIFTILCDVWIQNPKKWTKWFSWLSKPLERLAYNFREVLQGKKTLEYARNDVRKTLHQMDGNLFPYGQIGTNVAELARQLMIRSESPCYAKLICSTCNKSDVANPPENFMHLTSSQSKSINAWFQNWQEEPFTDCQQCHTRQYVIRKFTTPPELLMFSLNVSGIAISKTIRVKSANHKDTILPLKGIVYSGDFHFTSRVISDKDVWFHDGMITKSKCQKEGHITDFSDKTFMTRLNTHAVLVIYAKK